MMRAIRLATVAGLALALTGAGTATALQEEQESEVAATQSAEKKSTAPETKVEEPGAASMEPQSLDEPMTAQEAEAHTAWVEQIWTSP